MCHTDTPRLATRRSAHYRIWANAVVGLPNCHALFPTLPTDCEPYMVPLHLTLPKTHFYQLKRLGVPVWRWDDMAVSSYSVATGYRTHLLHLPATRSLPTNKCAG